MLGHQRCYVCDTCCSLQHIAAPTPSRFPSNAYIHRAGLKRPLNRTGFRLGPNTLQRRARRSTPTVVSSFPASYYRNSSNGTSGHLSSKLNSCSKGTNFDISTLFAIYGMESDDLLLTCEDLMSHFLDGQCANRNLKAPGCSKVARSVQSQIKMAVTITEAIIAHCEH